MKVFLPYGIGFDLLEGDGVQLTIPEGSSLDGSGWVDEKFLVFGRAFNDKQNMKFTFWRVGI